MMNTTQFCEEFRQKIRRRIQESLDGREEVILLSQEGCGACKIVKEFISNAIKNGRVRVVNTDTEEGETIMNELNISSVPASVVKKAGTYNELDLKEFLLQFGNEH